MAMKRGLGKGLNALFEDTNSEYDIAQTFETTQNPDQFEISLDKVYPNKNQPRKHFDADALDELKNSIKTHGIISPIIVIKEDEGYMIVAGERRYRAAKLAGLETVPVIVKEYNAKKIAEVSLIENLQREDLNVVESAHGIRELMEKYEMTQQEVSNKIGKSRSNIANILRILSLPSVTTDYIINGQISYGHGKCLAGIENMELCEAVSIECVEKEYSVRETEKIVQYINKNGITLEEYVSKGKKKEPNKADENMDEFQKLLERRFSTKVKIEGNQETGTIKISYFTKDDLQRFYEMLT